jgi:preprotein translocase subunit SecA
MIDNFLANLFPDPTEKKVKQYAKKLEVIHAFEKDFSSFSLDDVKMKTAEFKKRFEWLDFQIEADSVKVRDILDEISLEAFALVKHTCSLLNGQDFELENGTSMQWNMVPYDVQLIGALSIHDWNISEMKTWEWKTLVATMPAYLNALSWNTVHIVTVNDYLAGRDALEMWVLYEALWLTAWVIHNALQKDAKQAAYNCDIVYATNNELGFDYLRDNMVVNLKDKVQSPLFFCIIDEVDSVLIDEARTPLIISMPDNEPTSKYGKFATMAKKLQSGKHYKVDEKQKNSTLTDEWVEAVEEMLGIENIYISDNYNDIHHIENAIKASSVYIKDKDYLVTDGEVVIIDEHTGRVLSGRRYSEWLHQAIEAKEGVKINQESKTLASITFQNYFRMYWKLSWMTGTAKTEEEEFYKVYGLETLVIPTNRPIVRDDRPDLLFKNEKGKFEYLLNFIAAEHETGRPILVGTVSVDKSEYISRRLTEKGIKHRVLNAKHHDAEAEIVADAGQKWAVTIATNMAWRGTDIKLWEGVIDVGWLAIIGTEKHETRRIDNQLRGRAWRQWDPWMTQFLISPNDDIMRIFGGDKLFRVFNSPVFASLPDNEPLTQSNMLTKRVTSVQKQVEGHNFDARKHVLEYDDVINKHRTIIYGKRNAILASENIHEDVVNMITSQVSKLVARSFDEYGERQEFIEKLNSFLGKQIIDTTVENDDVSGIDSVELMQDYVEKAVLEDVEKLKAEFPDVEQFYELERRVVLQSIDELWMTHIHSMTKLRESVAFEGYAQKNPLVVYKEKAYEKFELLMWEVEYKTTKAMFSITPQTRIVVENPDLDKAELEEMVQGLEWLINREANKSKQQSSAQPQSSWGNPLFNNPNGGWWAHPQARRVAPPWVKVKKLKSSESWSDDNSPKTKIRV